MKIASIYFPIINVPCKFIDSILIKKKIVSEPEYMIQIYAILSSFNLPRYQGY